jgi:hypothetical protein
MPAKHRPDSQVEYLPSGLSVDAILTCLSFNSKVVVRVPAKAAHLHRRARRNWDLQCSTYL